MKATQFLRIIDALLEPQPPTHALAAQWGVSERTARRHIISIDQIRLALQQRGITIQKGKQ